MPLLVLYLKGNWPLRKVIPPLVIIPILWYFTYAPLHELSHAAGIYLVGGKAIGYKLIPSFWLGEFSGAWVIPSGITQSWQQLTMSAFPLILDIVSFVAAIFVFRRCSSRNPFFIGLAFMLLCLRPAFDIVGETLGLLTGWRGDVWYMQQIAGPFATWSFILISIGLAAYSISSTLSHFVSFSKHQLGKIPMKQNTISFKKETKMKTLHKFGGFAALYLAAGYIMGMIGFLGVVDVSSVADPIQQVALMADNLAFLYILHLLTYVVWGIFMVVLTLALYERLKAGSPAIVQTATVFGIFWGCVIFIAGMIHNVGMQTVVDLYGQDPTQAGTVWLTIHSVFAGLGGANEAIGGIWILLISWAALRTRALSKVLNYLGVVVGVAGIISIVPALGELFIYIFALGQIVWFIWLGIVMLRSNPSTVAQKTDAFMSRHSTTNI